MTEMCAAVLLAVLGSGALPAMAADDPATQPAQMTEAAAKQKYNAAMTKAADERTAAIDAADKQYIDDLTAALSVAMAKGVSGLDDAKRIDTLRQAAIAAAQQRKAPPAATAPAAQKPPETPSATLTRRLGGTTWTAPKGGTFYFKTDGTLVSSGNREVATWTALDGHFIIRKTADAWIDVLIFNDDITSFSLLPKDFAKPQDSNFRGTRTPN